MPTIQIRIDDKIKTASTALFNQLGITMSEAINIFLRQAVMRGGIPFPLTVPEGNLNSVGLAEIPDNFVAEVLGHEAILDALKRYKAVNNKTDFDIAKAEPFFRAIEAIDSGRSMKITLQENAVKARLNYKGKEFVFDYNFEEPDNVFILTRKGGKLFVKDCHIAETGKVLERF